MKQSKKLLKSNLLDKYSIVYGFTTKIAGDFRYDNKIELAGLFKIDPQNIITMSQVHGNTVGLLGGGPEGLPRGDRQFDGMVTSLKNTYLVVKVADCVPILFYDPIKEIVAVCHAGWKGTEQRIQQLIIQKMETMGSKPNNIVAVLGPHICAGCYDVPRERAIKFKNHIKINDKYYLDLGKENTEQLKIAGVKKIEDLNICTSCQNKLLYSYRKEGNKHGEQAALIGMRQ